MSSYVGMYVFFNKKINQQELKEAIDIAFKQESVSVDYFIRKDRDFNNTEILSGITFHFKKWSIRFTIHNFEEDVKEVNFIVLDTSNSDESRKFYDALGEDAFEELLMPLSKLPICRAIGWSDGYDTPTLYTEFEQGLLKYELSWCYLSESDYDLWPEYLRKS